jgi:hypothetical protein
MLTRIIVTFSAKVQINKHLNILNSIHPVASAAIYIGSRDRQTIITTCIQMFYSSSLRVLIKGRHQAAVHVI